MWNTLSPQTHVTHTLLPLPFISFQHKSPMPEFTNFPQAFSKRQPNKIVYSSMHKHVCWKNVWLCKCVTFNKYRLCLSTPEKQRCPYLNAAVVLHLLMQYCFALWSCLAHIFVIFLHKIKWRKCWISSVLWFIYLTRLDQLEAKILESHIIRAKNMNHVFC